MELFTLFDEYPTLPIDMYWLQHSLNINDISDQVKTARMVGLDQDNFNYMVNQFIDKKFSILHEKKVFPDWLPFEVGKIIFQFENEAIYFVIKCAYSIRFAGGMFADMSLYSGTCSSWFTQLNPDDPIYSQNHNIHHATISFNIRLLQFHILHTDPRTMQKQCQYIWMRLLGIHSSACHDDTFIQLLSQLLEFDSMLFKFPHSLSNCKTIRHTYESLIHFMS